jgi:hypothetical protein
MPKFKFELKAPNIGSVKPVSTYNAPSTNNSKAFKEAVSFVTYNKKKENADNKRQNEINDLKQKEIIRQQFHEFGNPLTPVYNKIFPKRSNGSMLPLEKEVNPYNTKEKLWLMGQSIEDYYKIPKIGVFNDFINPLHIASSGIISPIVSAPKESQDVKDYYNSTTDNTPLIFNKNLDPYIPYAGAAISTAFSLPMLRGANSFVKTPLKSINTLAKIPGRALRDIKYSDNTIIHNGKLYKNSYNLLNNNKFKQGLSKEHINFLNKEIQQRGILEHQRASPLNINSILSKKGIIAEDYNHKKVVKDFLPNLFKSKEEIAKKYTMGSGRQEAFNTYLGQPTTNPSFQIHSGSFKNGEGLIYTLPSSKNLLNSSKELVKLSKTDLEYANLLNNHLKTPSFKNKFEIYKHLKNQGYELPSVNEFDPKIFEDHHINYPATKDIFPAVDVYNGIGGNMYLNLSPNKASFKDVFDVHPFSRIKKAPKFIKNFNAKNILGGRDFTVKNTYNIDKLKRIKQTFKNGGISY